MYLAEPRPFFELLLHATRAQLGDRVARHVARAPQQVGGGADEGGAAGLGPLQVGATGLGGGAGLGPLGPLLQTEVDQVRLFGLGVDVLGRLLGDLGLDCDRPMRESTRGEAGARRRVWVW